MMTLPLSLPATCSPQLAGNSTERAGTGASVLESLPTPHESQQHVLDTARRFNVANCGRRYGKTELAKRILATGALNGERVAYLAPTYPMAHQFYREMADALHGHYSARENNRRLSFPGGGFIDIWSLENGGDRVRGQKYHRVVLDECAIVIGLANIWEKVVRPTLTDYRGTAWFLSTPRRGSDFEALYRRGMDEPDWMSWHLTTAHNPTIDPAEIEAARQSMSDAAFRQEYLAEFEASESDLVFPEFDRHIHVREKAVSWADCKWRVVGIDPGGGDPTAIVPLGVTASEHIHQYGEFYKRGEVSLDDVIQYVARLNAAGPLDMVVIDPSAKGWVEQLRRYGFNAQPANNNRGAGLESVRWMLGNGRLTIGPECTNSIAEFANYRWAKRRDGDTGERYATNAANDHHADAMDARRYALMAILNGLPSARQGRPMRVDYGRQV